MDRSNRPDAERRPGIVSCAWVLKGTRVPVQAIVDNANDGVPAEAIVTGIYDPPRLEATRRVIAFARCHVVRSI